MNLILANLVEIYLLSLSNCRLPTLPGVPTTPAILQLGAFREIVFDRGRIGLTTFQRVNDLLASIKTVLGYSVAFVGGGDAQGAS